MRKRLLGTLAAVAAGAGAAAGQAPAPPPPAPIAPAGSFTSPIPVGIGGPGMEAYGPGGPGMGGMPTGPYPGDPGMMGGYGMPPMDGYGMGGPAMPPGLHGQQNWESPPPPHPNRSLNSRVAPKFWYTADYLLYFAKAQPTQLPFVTTSAPADNGIPGNPTTTILHSRSDLGYNVISGFRFDLGCFRDDCRRYGWYLNGFFMEQKSNTFYAGTDRSGQPLLARPFLDATSGGAPNVLLVSFPTFSSGRVAVNSSTQAWGAEGGPIANLYRSEPDAACIWNVNLLTAFRFLQIEENLNISQSSTLLGAATAPFDGKQYAAPATIEVRDMFNTVNNFYGGQAGLQSDVRSGRFMFSATGKLAMGVMHQTANIRGFSALSDPTRGISSQVTGGLFANASNIGTYNNDEFAVIPEVNLAFGYNWRSWLSTSVGYNFLYVSKVARPGNQYSATVNPGIVPTSPSYGFAPAVATPNNLFVQDDYWLQGVNFGINIRY